MYNLIHARLSRDLDRFCTGRFLPPLSPLTLCRPAADDHWMLADKSGEIVARCSLWWSNTPSLDGRSVGLIGHYAAQDGEAGSILLNLASEILASQGCALAVGPMDGNAWQPYRLVIEPGDEPPFFLEPQNPSDWPGHFIENGFAILAGYTSALNPDLAQPDPRLAELEQRAAAQDLSIRPLQAAAFTEELRRIYAIATAAFQNNLLYSSIAEADFIAQYEPLQPCIRPELVLLAEDDGQVVGFIFAIPDLLQAQRGQAIDTIVIKTIAVLPEYSGSGLGSLLAARCQETAGQLGYKRAIHALMHESNRSRTISARYAHTIRRYALFARELLS
ncbi:MAG: hypothetical protein KatS3mg057_0582 [Herpetosiphonaceae bacterium]|nr:MAG: hypothetical protein KatS3mg057_0582 [Herpetosiphonaceae bacterium]